jgi:hypothetical protein
MLCFWHVIKSWAENARNKISRIEDRAATLKAVGNVMYGTGFKHDMDPRQWALQQLDRIRREQPRSEKFLKYMDEHWRGKVDMWLYTA